jgi:AcrR family transcriptional regulator
MARPKEFDPDKALGEALLLFWERGYEATSIDDIVTRLNLNRSSLYHTFGDKHALFLQTLRAYHQRVLRNVEAALGVDDAVTQHSERLRCWQPAKCRLDVSQHALMIGAQRL